MEVKKNKFVSDNQALSDNLNNNTVASNNNIGNDNFSKNSLFSFINCFNGLDKTIALFFPSIREAMVERYRAETLCRIGIKASDILQILGISANPIPPKGAIPLFDKLSLEHEEEMYDVWAKLLVEMAIEYNPIQLQYADILSKIGSNEAKLLKEIYLKQKQHGGSLLEIGYIQSQGKELVKGHKLLSARLEGEALYLNDPVPADFEFIFPYYMEAEPKPNTENSLQQDVIQKDFSQEVITSVNLLVQLNLIHKKYTVSHDRYDKGCCAISKIGILLTEFGYSMVDCLERKNNATEELSK